MVELDSPSDMINFSLSYIAKSMIVKVKKYWIGFIRNI